MPNSDPYLRVGLTPTTDVQLYASEALGGYSKSGTGTAQGVASGTKSVTSDRTGMGIANGTAAGGSDITYTKTGAATAEAVAAGAKAVERAEAGTGIAQGVGSGAQTVTGAGAASASPSTYGNALGTYYVQPPDFRPEIIRARRCRCRNGAASLACEMHCHLAVITRQHVEDELLVLALV